MSRPLVLAIAGSETPGCSAMRNCDAKNAASSAAVGNEYTAGAARLTEVRGLGLKKAARIRALVG